jgi:HK97 family phage major capsid protein
MDLTTKNRKAQELRSKAKAIRAEIADIEKPLTRAELDAKVAEALDLEHRANTIAEFTADDEVRRQGGEEVDIDLDTGAAAGEGEGAEGGKRATVKLTRVDGEGAGGKRVVRSATMSDRIADFAHRVQREFGDVRSFMKIAVAGTDPIRTAGQRKMIEEARTMTRAIIGDSGHASGGEVLLPLTQVAEIFALENVQQGIMQRARIYNVPGRELRIPYLLQTGGDGTNVRPMAGNIANVDIIGEGSTKTVREPKFGQRLLRVHKYAAITQSGDELLGDDFTGELPTTFVNAVGQQALNRVNEDVTVSGTGSSMPLGAIYPGAHNIGVTRASSSSYSTADIFGMYDRHTHGPGSFWLASRRSLGPLMALQLSSGSMITYLKSLGEKPQMQLLGLPVVLSDLPNTFGTQGDLSLINPDFYALALRQALTVERSRDYAFVQDLTTWRFIVRAGGIPINDGTYAYKYAGTAQVDSHSPFVYLD